MTPDEALPRRIREHCREAFATSLQGLVAIALNDTPDSAIKPNEQIAAVKLLGDYAFRDSKSLALEAAEWMPALAKVTAEFLPDAQSFLCWYERVQRVMRGEST